MSLSNIYSGLTWVCVSACCVCVSVFYSYPQGSRSSLEGARSSLEGARPVGQVDKHILLLVHGVGSAGKTGV